MELSVLVIWELVMRLNLIKGEVPEIELTAVADLKEARKKWAEKGASG